MSIDVWPFRSDDAADKIWSPLVLPALCNRPTTTAERFTTPAHKIDLSATTTTSTIVADDPSSSSSSDLVSPACGEEQSDAFLPAALTNDDVWTYRAPIDLHCYETELVSFHPPPPSSSQSSSSLVNNDSSPCLVNNDSSPCLANKDSLPCLVNKDSSPCLVNNDSSSCPVNKEKQAIEKETVEKSISDAQPSCPEYKSRFANLVIYTPFLQMPFHKSVNNNDTPIDERMGQKRKRTATHFTMAGNHSRTSSKRARTNSHPSLTKTDLNSHSATIAAAAATTATTASTTTTASTKITTSTSRMQQPEARSTTTVCKTGAPSVKKVWSNRPPIIESPYARIQRTEPIATLEYQVLKRALVPRRQSSLLSDEYLNKFVTCEIRIIECPLEEHITNQVNLFELLSVASQMAGKHAARTRHQSLSDVVLRWPRVQSAYFVAKDLYMCCTATYNVAKFRQYFPVCYRRRSTVSFGKYMLETALLTLPGVFYYLAYVTRAPHAFHLLETICAFLTPVADPPTALPVLTPSPTCLPLLPAPLPTPIPPTLLSSPLIAATSPSTSIAEHK